MKKTVRFLSVAVALAVSAVALTACGSSPQASSAGSAEQTTAAAADTSSQASDGFLSDAGNDYQMSSQADTPAGMVSGTVTFKETSFTATTESGFPPQVYYWSKANTKMTEWPGDKMTGSGDTYTFTIPSSAEYIIFTDGVGVDQTIDIPFDGANTDFVVTSETDDKGHYKVTTASGSSIEEEKPYTSEQQISSSQMKVSVAGTDVQKDYYNDGHTYSTDGGLDGLLFEIKNSDSVDASHTTLYVICFDQNGNTVKPGIDYSFNPEYETDLIVLSSTAVIKSGDTAKIGYKCGANGAVRCEAIIAEYVAGGVHYINADAASWASQYITAK